MRREKTLKVCANHYILPSMELKSNVGSDRSWVYACPADASENEIKKETFAVRFGNPDIAKEFKDAFENAKVLVAEKKQGTIVKSDAEEKTEEKKAESA